MSKRGRKRNNRLLRPAGGWGSGDPSDGGGTGDLDCIDLEHARPEPAARSGSSACVVFAAGVWLCFGKEPYEYWPAMGGSRTVVLTRVGSAVRRVAARGAVSVSTSPARRISSYGAILELTKILRKPNSSLLIYSVESKYSVVILETRPDEGGHIRGVRLG